MKLYSLSIHHKGATKANLLKAAYDLSSFSFFQRSSVQEFMTFTSALIVERTSQGSRASVKEQEYLCHVYVRNDNLSAVVVADTEYPQRVCFTLLDKVLEEFSRQVDSIEWPSGSPETINYKALDIHLSKYQNPREADAMTKVQAELDETKIILVNNYPLLNLISSIVCKCFLFVSLKQNKPVWTNITHFSFLLKVRLFFDHNVALHAWKTT
uniref:YKT6 v-SNARE homolog (S. cerevisiae) n=1 Tax=Labrus bergylta TaxID=56723 RepID=A0A3Q3GF43_9LABR